MPVLLNPPVLRLVSTCPDVPLTPAFHTPSMLIRRLLRVSKRSPHPLARGNVLSSQDPVIPADGFRGPGMAEFRGKRARRVPGKVLQPLVNVASQTSDRQRRRGVRVNSRVPLAVQWAAGGETLKKDAQTRVVGPYGCLLVLAQNLEVKQEVELTNLASKQSSSARVVWRGVERAEGWELGIELINPQMGFWGLDL